VDVAQILSGVLGLLIGGGGIAALLRALGQNHADARTALTDAEAQFRAALLQMVASLQTRVTALEQEKITLANDNLSLRAEVVQLRNDLREMTEERDGLTRIVERQQAELSELRERLGELEAGYDHAPALGGST
jgi:predicted  nucleic acid-binding Zn-ribbon protein